ncbi:hypothetical protein [Pyxidicoccus xibeiensis]|uniref:hypothetical protein n=1 Tax=Pyxidicoccus xibeiensis TaxID=2906759 RepID=UPI0020A7CA3B|nr:hypothetical protein [Pyxidicoccus xibeiensis]MCP3144130.1 hypothetical protein [Pyxidicoccus xibeiensis]
MSTGSSLTLNDSCEQDPGPTWSTPSFASGAEVASDGTRSLVVWRDGSRPGELLAARVSKGGRLLDPESLTLNPSPSVQAGAPAVAYDGRQFLVVWQGEHSLFLARVKPDGTVDGPVLPIVNISGDPSSTPGIACTWRRCLVAWSDFGDPRRIRGVLVKSHDTGVRTQELTLASDAVALSSFGVPVAWSDNRFLVAWSDTRFGDTTPKLLATRVTSDGAVLDPTGILISDTPGAQTWLDVVGTQQGFFVAWSDTRHGTRDLFGTFVRPNGSVPDADGFLLSSTDPGDDVLPSLASDGQRVLATWSRVGPDRFSIRGNLVKPDGTVSTLDGFPLSDGDFVREVEQDVVFQDGQYFMAYSAAPAIDEPPFQVILGTRVRSDGTRVDDPAVRISHSPSVESAQQQ